MNKAALQSGMEFARQRTEDLMETLASQPNVDAILRWRPGPSRAHIAWQLMHLGATDDRHLNILMKGGQPTKPDYVQRFAGGSTPDEDVPSLAEIRSYLKERREGLLAHLQTLDDSDLPNKPHAEAKWAYGEWFQLLTWHEAHHQGQAHLTLNLYKAANPA